MVVSYTQSRIINVTCKLVSRAMDDIMYLNSSMYVQ